ncbi:leucine--tRNA ligase [Nakamurella endophytica]|uniref:Leucine--tRNA ligase n=1 Tax=Nakamurella endophytica TaxID=1748367 RepID=A0A917SUB8_9ACTN|nr:leucine--tRNA ligase [Nakamurella endophytica]GGL96818.1 leucine--tRNA ligase [Nakamurella endophytica]
MTGDQDSIDTGGPAAPDAGVATDVDTDAATDVATDTRPAGDVPAHRYTAELANRIEARWQDRWEAEGTFRAPNPAGPLAPADPARVPADKMYVLDMFPYPSGAGLHVGHPLGYIGTDVLGRFMRMTGRNVLHTVGFDAFGLPAEQYAIRTGTHPRETTAQNVERYRSQLRRLGFAHDSRRSVSTTDPEFFRWTQWIFLQLFGAWYDERAGRARPVAELAAEYAAGERTTPDGRRWAELSHAEQEAVLAGRRLAYVAMAPVNWCPGLGTVLSNEEVTADGRSEIGNFPVFRRNLRQWMMRITDYADRLIDDLDRLDWPESVKAMQRNWIGRSTGAEIRFRVLPADPAAGRDDRSPVPGDDDLPTFTVFTTRPDTLFGATYAVLAPEHPLVGDLTADEWPAGTPESWTGGAPTPAEAVARYRAAAARKSDLERQENREKTGVFTGSYAVNPANGARLPVFIADYVLTGYGTGAIMAVPGQDVRDWDFAKVFDLPVVRTVQPAPGHPDDEAFTGEGPAINSANLELDLNGLPVAEAKAAMIDWLVARGAGRARTQYKLRDWLFSRQRYWGEPFPIVYDDEGTAIALPDDQLPLTLPEMVDFAPAAADPDDATSDPQPPLARATEWATVELDLGDGPRTYRRELNVMPQWAGSCWYEMRYLDPTNDEAFCDPVVERYWMGPDPARPGDPGGVDLYVGGVEHAVLHLLYSRFWHKVLYDLGHVSSEEPFRRLFNQGYIQAYAYTDDRGFYVPAEEVTEGTGETAGRFFHDGQEVHREYGKMGKSLNNVVTPDDMCRRYGADTFRMYEMGMGPLDVSRPWQTRDVVGPQRYLQRLWRIVVSEETGETVVSDEPADEATRALLHRTIDGVRTDLAGMSYNTAIAKLIVLANYVTKSAAPASREVAEALVLMTAPLAPHIAEELWQRLGHRTSLGHGPFPEADPALLGVAEVEYPIQVRGKVRARVTVPADAPVEAVESAALAEPRVVELLEGSRPRKIVVVPGRMVSIVP